MQDVLKGRIACPVCRTAITAGQLKRAAPDDPLNCRECGVYVTTPDKSVKTVTGQEIQRILSRYKEALRAGHGL